MSHLQSRTATHLAVLTPDEILGACSSLAQMSGAAVSSTSLLTTLAASGYGAFSSELAHGNAHAAPCQLFRPLSIASAEQLPDRPRLARHDVAALVAHVCQTPTTASAARAGQRVAREIADLLAIDHARRKQPDSQSHDSCPCPCKDVDDTVASRAHDITCGMLDTGSPWLAATVRDARDVLLPSSRVARHIPASPCSTLMYSAISAQILGHIKYYSARTAYVFCHSAVLSRLVDAAARHSSAVTRRRSAIVISARQSAANILVSDSVRDPLPHTLAPDSDTNSDSDSDTDMDTDTDTDSAGRPRQGACSHTTTQQHEPEYLASQDDGMLAQILADEQKRAQSMVAPTVRTETVTPDVCALEEIQAGRVALLCAVADGCPTEVAEALAALISAASFCGPDRPAAAAAALAAACIVGGRYSWSPTFGSGHADQRGPKSASPCTHLAGRRSWSAGCCSVLAALAVAVAARAAAAGGIFVLAPAAAYRSRLCDLAVSCCRSALSVAPANSWLQVFMLRHVFDAFLCSSVRPLESQFNADEQSSPDEHVPLYQDDDSAVRMVVLAVRRRCIPATATCSTAAYLCARSCLGPELAAAIPVGRLSAVVAECRHACSQANIQFVDNGTASSPDEFVDIIGTFSWMSRDPGLRSAAVDAFCYAMRLAILAPTSVPQASRVLAELLVAVSRAGSSLDNSPFTDLLADMVIDIFSATAPAFSSAKSSSSSSAVGTNVRLTMCLVHELACFSDRGTAAALRGLLFAPSAPAILAEPEWTAISAADINLRFCTAFAFRAVLARSASTSFPADRPLEPSGSTMRQSAPDLLDSFVPTYFLRYVAQDTKIIWPDIIARMSPTLRVPAACSDIKSRASIISGVALGPFPADKTLRSGLGLGTKSQQKLQQKSVLRAEPNGKQKLKQASSGTKRPAGQNASRVRDRTNVHQDQTRDTAAPAKSQGMFASLSSRLFGSLDAYMGSDDDDDDVDVDVDYDGSASGGVAPADGSDDSDSRHAAPIAAGMGMGIVVPEKRPQYQTSAICDDRSDNPAPPAAYCPSAALPVAGEEDDDDDDSDRDRGKDETPTGEDGSTPEDPRARRLIETSDIALPGNRHLADAIDMAITALSLVSDDAFARAASMVISGLSPLGHAKASATAILCGAAVARDGRSVRIVLDEYQLFDFGPPKPRDYIRLQSRAYDADDRDFKDITKAWRVAASTALATAGLFVAAQETVVFTPLCFAHRRRKGELDRSEVHQRAACDPPEPKIMTETRHQTYAMELCAEVGLFYRLDTAAAAAPELSWLELAIDTARVLIPLDEHDAGGSPDIGSKQPGGMAEFVLYGLSSVAPAILVGREIVLLHTESGHISSPVINYESMRLASSSRDRPRIRSQQHLVSLAPIRRRVVAAVSLIDTVCLAIASCATRGPFAPHMPQYSMLCYAFLNVVTCAAHVANLVLHTRAADDRVLTLCATAAVCVVSRAAQFIRAALVAAPLGSTPVSRQQLRQSGSPEWLQFCAAFGLAGSVSGPGTGSPSLAAGDAAVIGTVDLFMPLLALATAVIGIGTPATPPIRFNSRYDLLFPDCWADKSSSKGTADRFFSTSLGNICESADVFASVILHLFGDNKHLLRLVVSESHLFCINLGPQRVDTTPVLARLATAILATCSDVSYGQSARIRVMVRSEACPEETEACPLGAARQEIEACPLGAARQETDSTLGSKIQPGRQTKGPHASASIFSDSEHAQFLALFSRYTASLAEPPAEGPKKR